MLVFLTVLLILALICIAILGWGAAIALEYLLIKVRGYGADREELWEALDRALCS